MIARLQIPLVCTAKVESVLRLLERQSLIATVNWFVGIVGGGNVLEMPMFQVMRLTSAFVFVSFRFRVPESRAGSTCHQRKMSWAGGAAC